MVSCNTLRVGWLGVITLDFRGLFNRISFCASTGSAVIVSTGSGVIASIIGSLVGGYLLVASFYNIRKSYTTHQAIYIRNG